MAAAAILNYCVVILDHPQMSVCPQEVVFKFRVDRMCTFGDTPVAIFANLASIAYLGLPKSCCFSMSYSSGTR